MTLNCEQLYQIKGGGFSAALGTWILNTLNFINEVGRNIGSAINYLIHGVKC